MVNMGELTSKGSADNSARFCDIANKTCLKLGVLFTI